jgi:hypothetical protein
MKNVLRILRTTGAAKIFGYVYMSFATFLKWFQALIT